MMEKYNLNIENLSSEELVKLILKGFTKEILPVIQTTDKEPELLTRKEIAKLLRVSLPTLHDWTKRGVVKAYRIEGKVYYKRSEIEESLTEIRAQKYSRA